MVKDVFHLIPRTAVQLDLDGLSRKRPWRRTDVGCSKAIWTQINDVHRRIQELKSLRVVKLHSVVTEQSSDAKRPNKRRAKFLARKIQVDVLG
jgi:hypothetical protein